MPNKCMECKKKGIPLKGVYQLAHRGVDRFEKLVGYICEKCERKVRNDN